MTLTRTAPYQATIEAVPGRLTLINPHVCVPGDQQPLVDLLIEGIGEIYSNVPGFISATILKSEDGMRVTNYAQYEDEASVKNAWRNPAVPAFAQSVGRVARAADPQLYEVVTTVAGEGRAPPVQLGNPEAGITLVDVHHCAETDQQDLVELFGDAVTAQYSKQPGFISASIHRGLNRTRVTNVAQWQSAAHFEALKSNADLERYREKVKSLLSGFDGMRGYIVAGAVGATT
jgi:heme-degrading monooxygenase HmoA